MGQANLYSYASVGDQQTETEHTEQPSKHRANQSAPHAQADLADRPRDWLQRLLRTTAGAQNGADAADHIIQPSNSSRPCGRDR